MLERERHPCRVETSGSGKDTSLLRLHRGLVRSTVRVVEGPALLARSLLGVCPDGAVWSSGGPHSWWTSFTRAEDVSPERTSSVAPSNIQAAVQPAQTTPSTT